MISELEVLMNVKIVERWTWLECIGKHEIMDIIGMLKFKFWIFRDHTTISNMHSFSDRLSHLLWLHSACCGVESGVLTTSFYVQATKILSIYVYLLRKPLETMD